MDKEEIIRRLEKISEHAVHFSGEPPLILSLDDGIALHEAAELLKEQEAEVEWCERCGRVRLKSKWEGR